MLSGVSPVVRPVLIASIFLALTGAAFLGGFLLAEHHLFPAPTIAWYEQKLWRLITPPEERKTTDTVISTLLLRLDTRRIPVPANPDITNGSLTRVSGGMLLMSGSGEIFFHAAGSDAVVRSGLAAPPNHLAEFHTAALDPSYAHNEQDSFAIPRYLHLFHVEDGLQRLLFISFTEWHPAGNCYTNTVARLDVTAQGPDPSAWSAGPGDWQVIFRTNPCLPLKKIARTIEAHISGGRMVFDAANRRLILTVGDFHWDGVANDVILSQDESNDYGKVIGFDLDGGNPRHFAKGLRNAQGIAFDEAGRLWVTEHGPNGGDELNLLVRGANYGWPLSTLGKGYDGLPWAPARQFGRHDDFVPPVYSWIPSLGISSIMQVTDFDPAWNGDFLVGTLSGRTVYRVRVVGDHVQFAEPIPFDERIRYILQPAKGVIALWTDSDNLILLTPAAADETGIHMERFVDSQPWTDERKAALRVALSGCTQCHSYREEAGRGAPHLAGVYNRPVAKTAFPMYSRQLQSLRGKWTEDRLVRFLVDTQGFVPGTSMPGTGLREETARDVVQALKALGTGN